MDLTKEQTDALRDLDKAADALKKSVGGRAGEGIEARYKEAYDKCYRLGLKQWKSKWSTDTR
jgi:hypothetical protein